MAIVSAQFLIDFITNYPQRNPGKSGTLINKDNQEVGYQITLSKNDYSNVKTYLLEEYIQAEDDPKNVTGVTDLQLEIILDYVTIRALGDTHVWVVLSYSI